MSIYPDFSAVAATRRVTLPTPKVPAAFGLLILAMLVILPLVPGTARAADTPASSQLPAIRHIFLIVLENKGFNETFGANSPATYLKSTLTAEGQLLTDYYGIGHNSLDNYIAMISGQAPNPQTQADCDYYTDFAGLPFLDQNGQAIGQGCVYPANVPTLANQLQQQGLSWGAYEEDMANGPGKSTCRHPAINTQDSTQSARLGDQYAARHNPFVYFHSIIDTPSCDQHDVDLSQLPQDLKHIKTTPNFVFITPNLCHDGHDSPCVDGAPGGLVSADQFLKQWVPLVLKSPAFKKNGLLVITFDEADTQALDSADACCSEIPGPNSPLPGITGPGGGRTGAVLISPFIEPGSVNTTAYNHYSLLRSVENIFGLAHLGFAGQTDLKAFGKDVFQHH